MLQIYRKVFFYECGGKNVKESVKIEFAEMFDVLVGGEGEKNLIDKEAESVVRETESTTGLSKRSASVTDAIKKKWLAQGVLRGNDVMNLKSW